MITEKVSYTDYNGNKRVETCMFNLTKAELYKLDQEYPGGMVAVAEKAMEEQDTKAMLNMFSDVIARSYGVKSEDGSRFVKDQKKTDEFLSSEAYSELLVSVLSDAEKARKFTVGLMNADSVVSGATKQ